MKRIVLVLSVIVLFGLFLYGCESNTNPIELAQDQHQELPQVVAPDDDCPPPEPPPEGGGARVTGGGSVFLPNGVRVTRGFELHCDTSEPNNLQVNWGPGNKFHLLELTDALCTDDPEISPEPPAAPFDTFEGWGEGRFNKEDGVATIHFIFKDAGEPGVDDWAWIEITYGSIVLDVSGYVDRGNIQFHSDKDCEDK